MTDETNTSTTETSPAAGGGDEGRVAELSRESAAYRTQRNEALRRASAYETMLKAHGVDTAPVTADALAKLPISEGRVDGKFEYAPPKIKVPEQKDPPKAGGEGKVAPTLDEVKTWSSDRINKRWDEVKSLLAKER